MCICASNLCEIGEGASSGFSFFFQRKGRKPMQPVHLVCLLRSWLPVWSKRTRPDDRLYLLQQCGKLFKILKVLTMALAPSWPCCTFFLLSFSFFLHYLNLGTLCEAHPFCCKLLLSNSIRSCTRTLFFGTGHALNSSVKHANREMKTQ